MRKTISCICIIVILLQFCACGDSAKEPPKPSSVAQRNLSSAKDSTMTDPDDCKETDRPGSSANKIEQILPIEDGSVAVLYSDGSVRVSGNAHFSREVSDWEGVTKLYYEHYSVFDGKPILLGITENKGLLTTEEDVYYFDEIDKLCFPHNGIVGIKQNGYLEFYGECSHLAYLIELKNVEDLVYSSISDIWGVLKKDGTVQLIGAGDPYAVYWNNVKELRDSGHGFYVIQNNGTVNGQMEKTYSGLNGAVKVVDYNDWVFGISADGRLLTHNGGNIYINTGDMMVAEPGLTCYGTEVDIHRFDQIRDIIVYRGLILLNRNGTVEHIGYEPVWDFSSWADIEKIYSCSDPDGRYMTLYGIRKDGSVIRSRYDRDLRSQTVSEQYHGWKLQDIYPGRGGIIGVTMDGRLVGDGIYESVDFSVFE